MVCVLNRIITTTTTKNIFNSVQLLIFQNSIFVESTEFLLNNRMTNLKESQTMLVDLVSVKFYFFAVLRTEFRMLTSLFGVVVDKRFISLHC